MAYIAKLTDKPRNKPWMAKVQRKGHKTLKKMFFAEVDAKRWAREQERNIDLVGLPLTIDALKKVSVGDIVKRYLEEKTPLKGCSVSETTVLKKFLTRDICKLSLAVVGEHDAYSYRDERLTLSASRQEVERIP